MSAHCSQPVEKTPPLGAIELAREEIDERENVGHEEWHLLPTASRGKAYTQEEKDACECGNGCVDREIAARVKQTIELHQEKSRHYGEKEGKGVETERYARYHYNDIEDAEERALKKVVHHRALGEPPARLLA